MLRPTKKFPESTSLQGYLKATYQDLVKKFGSPNQEGDGCKVQAEWVLEADDGTTVTIYDWKEYGRSPEQVTDWHIGGVKQRAVELIQQAFPNHKAVSAY